MSWAVASALLSLKRKVIAAYELMSTGSMLDSAKMAGARNNGLTVYSDRGEPNRTKRMVSGHMATGMYAFAACDRLGAAVVRAATLAKRVRAVFLHRTVQRQGVDHFC